MVAAAAVPMREQDVMALQMMLLQTPFAALYERNRFHYENSNPISIS